MALELLLVAGILVALFVGVNIGGSSTGVAFGPAVGSDLLSKRSAAGLMTFFVLLGGWTVGRNVINTMGGKIVPSSAFTLLASAVILFFIGGALLLSNVFGVPASTSMTAVGAIAGMGVATGSLDWGVMGRIVSWWFVAPVIAFWAGAVLGRYLYPHLQQVFEVDTSDGPLLVRASSFPYIERGAGTSRGELAGSVAVLGIGCFMAFSAGASNVANAVAPLVGNGAIDIGPAILLGVVAIGAGAFTLGRRTLETVGSGLTEMPLLVAMLVSVVSASIITTLSWMGIPASLAISSTMCIAGLGWGRATRTVALKDTIKGEASATAGMGALKEDADDDAAVPPIGEEDPAAGEVAGTDLFDPQMVARIVSLWIATPTLSGTASFLIFSFVL